MEDDERKDKTKSTVSTIKCLHQAQTNTEDGRERIRRKQFLCLHQGQTNTEDEQRKQKKKPVKTKTDSSG